jgi:hypothetical protein
VSAADDHEVAGIGPASPMISLLLRRDSPRAAALALAALALSSAALLGPAQAASAHGAGGSRTGAGCGSSARPPVRTARVRAARMAARTGACAGSKRHARTKHARRHRGHRGSPRSPTKHTPLRPLRTAPECEDGSAATSTAGEGPLCDDGSEPQCPATSTTKLSSAGTVLYCVAEPEPATAFGSEGCEDTGGPESGCTTIASPEGSTPPCQGGAPASAHGEGEYKCPDGSEPHCEEGSQLTLVPGEGGGSLMCEAATAPPVPEGP